MLQWCIALQCVRTLPGQLKHRDLDNSGRCREWSRTGASRESGARRAIWGLTPMKSRKNQSRLSAGILAEVLIAVRGGIDDDVGVGGRKFR